MTTGWLYGQNKWGPVSFMHLSFSACMCNFTSDKWVGSGLVWSPGLWLTSLDAVQINGKSTLTKFSVSEFQGFNILWFINKINNEQLIHQLWLLNIMMYIDIHFECYHLLLCNLCFTILLYWSIKWLMYNGKKKKLKTNNNKNLEIAYRI